MAECTSEQQLRGIARYSDDAVSDEFADLLRAGTLAITIEPHQGESYQGIVPLAQHTLAACLEEYFLRSEQLESRFFLASDGVTCAGLLLQQLPAQLLKDEELRHEEWSTVSQLAATLTSNELLSLTNEETLYRLFHQHRIKLFDQKPVVYQCSCSRERTARALHAIGEEEVMSIIAEQGAVEITCEFCGKQYRFMEGELGLLFESPADKRAH
jgi:molecular chaperone Hsp33